jgi:hypothetical protein
MSLKYRGFCRLFSFIGFLFTFSIISPAQTPTPSPTLDPEEILNGKIVAETPEARVQFNDKKPSNLAYAGEIPLNAFPPGRYDLRITAKDKIAKTQAVQEVNFGVR